MLLPAAACRPSADRAPNIILVMVDTLRADYLGAYGFEGEVSPNLDRLAAESVVFRSCFSQSPWTKPAVASLFTSLYPQVHGLTNHEGEFWGDVSAETTTGVLSGRATTLAESLHAGGYETAAFVSNPWVGAEYGFGQGFDLYNDEFQNWITSVVDITAAARNWLASRKSTSPYFLYLHFMDVHAPYYAPYKDYSLLRRSPSVASDRVLRPDEMPDARFHNIEVRSKWATDEIRAEVAYWRTRYASGVRAFDRTLGEFVEHLRQSGELDQSLFVFTSDHGEELFEHRSWSHGQNLYDHQLHVPLIVRKPQGEDGGLESESLVELVDLMPTLLREVGVDAPLGMQGRDVSAALSGRRDQSPGITFATATQKRPGLYSARTANYKLIADIGSTWERLYDLRDDPAELQNVASLEAGIAADLHERLLTHIRESVAGGILESESKTLSPEEQERLKALGYLQ